MRCFGWGLVGWCPRPFQLLQQSFKDWVAYSNRNLLPVVLKAGSWKSGSSSHGRKRKWTLSWLKRALTPSWHPPIMVSSNPNHPPKAPFLNTVTWKVEFQHMDLGEEGHKHSVHNSWYLSLPGRVTERWVFLVGKVACVAKKKKAQLEGLPWWSSG